MPRMSKLRQKEALTGYLFIMPWLLGFLLFTAGPMLFSLFASFTNYDITSQMRWVGFDNYRRLFFDDQFFWVSLGNTAFYAVFAVPLSIGVGLTIAVLLNQKIPGQRVFRTIFFLPKVLTGVAVLLLWLWVFNPDLGPINTFLRAIGIKYPPFWFGDPLWAKPALIIMSMWGAAGGTSSTLLDFRAFPKSFTKLPIWTGPPPCSGFSASPCP